MFDNTIKESWIASYLPMLFIVSLSLSIAISGDGVFAACYLNPSFQTHLWPLKHIWNSINSYKIHMFHLLLQFCPFFFCQLTPGHVYATPSSGSFRRSMAQSDGVARQHAFAELGMAAVTYLQDVPWEFYSIIRLIYTAIYIYICAVCVCVCMYM